MRLFISYAHVNRSKVDELEKLLEKAGNEVWFDHELIGGDNWWQSILSEIEQSDVFVFALSPQSTGSAACRAEFQYALDLNKPILPILLKESELPVGKLTETQYVDARRLNSNDTVMAITRSLLNLQKQIFNGAYAKPDGVPRPAFPFEADPLKDVREQVRNLQGTPEEDIVRIIFRLKQVGRLSDKSVRETRMLLETIMTAPHVPHSVAMEAKDALKSLPQTGKLPTWIYAAGGIAGIFVVIVAILAISNPQILVGSVPTSTPTEFPTSTLNPTETPTPTITFTPSPTERFIPTPANGRSVITADNAAQVERLEWLGRGVPYYVSWSPDGKTLAVGTTIGIWLYERDNLDAPPRLLEGHTSGIRGIDFSPDSKILASVSPDGTLRLWDVTTNKLIGEPITPFNGWALDVAFSPTGKLLSVGGCWGFKLYDVTNPAEPIESRSQDVGVDCVGAVAFSRDGSHVGYTTKQDDSADPFVEVMDVNTGETLPLGTHEGDILSLAFNPDGSILASGGDDRLIRLWNTENGELIETLEGHSSRIRSLRFTSDGEQLISASGDRQILVWDVASGTQIGDPLEGSIVGGVSIALSPDGTQFVSAGNDGTLRFWNVIERKTVEEYLNLFTTWGKGVTFAYDGKVAVAYNDGSVHLWDMSTQSDSSIGKHESGGNTPIVISPTDPNLLASGGRDDKVRVYNLTMGEEIKVFERDDGGNSINGNVYGLAFSPDGTRIAAAMGGNDDVVRLWNVTDSKEEILREAHDDVLSVAFSPNGSLLASGHKDGAVIIWDLQTNESRFILLEHTAPVQTVIFSPDGQYLFSGSDDKSIRIWDVEAGRSGGKTLNNPTDIVKSLAFSPDGKLLAAAVQFASEILLWDTTNMAEPVLLNTNISPVFASVYSLSFSADGTLLAASGDPGAISIWGVCSVEVGDECDS